jgi:hypothetical protein
MARSERRKGGSERKKGRKERSLEWKEEMEIMKGNTKNE